MSKINVGDIFRKVAGSPRAGEDITVHQVLFGEVTYQYNNEDLGDYWTKEGTCCLNLTDFQEVFKLVSDDELPPVPQDVRYECNHSPGRDYVRVALLSPDIKNVISLKVRENRDDAIIHLSVETALDLASDLLRMALKLKREQEVKDE